MYRSVCTSCAACLRAGRKAPCIPSHHQEDKIPLAKQVETAQPPTTDGQLSPLQTLQEVLRVDAANRYSGVSGDLFQLGGQTPMTLKKWDNSLPTWQKYCHQDGQEQDPIVFHDKLTNMKFKVALLRRFPILMDLPMNGERGLHGGILLAGGAVQKTIQQVAQTLKWRDDNPYKRREKGDKTQHDGITDLDLFLYGLGGTEQENGALALTRINYICSHVDTFAREMDYVVRYVRTENAITISVYKSEDYPPLYILQIILRLYATPSEILHGFDLGSSAVGWNGHAVIFTSLSRFAYTYGMNVFDNTRRSTTYEKRMAKYMSRGFGFVLPKWRFTPPEGQMQRSTFYYVRLNDHLTIDILKRDGNLFMVNVRAHGQSFSDYGSRNLGESALTEHNVTQLLRDTPENIIYSGKDRMYVITGICALNMEHVEKLYDYVFARLSRGKMCNSDYGWLRYITVTPVKTVLKSLGDKEAMNAIRAVEIASLVEQVTKLQKNSMPIKFRVEDPGTQLTGSFNPIREGEKAWYGEMYDEQMH